MEVTVVWSKQARKNLTKTLKYLEKEWTHKEILRLERNIHAFILRIIRFPDIYPSTTNSKHLHKGMVDENNYIVYRVYLESKKIMIVNFRDSKQSPIY